MSEYRNTPDAEQANCFKEAVCINANKIFDSCSDKDCVTDLQVYFTETTQLIVDSSVTVKCRSVEIINVYLDVEPVPFNRGFYSVDMTFFFDVKLNAYASPVAPPVAVHGFASFCKKVILYGSEGNVKVFDSNTSIFSADAIDCPVTNRPRASVQVVDPICLSCKLIEPCDCCCEMPVTVPPAIANRYDGAFASAPGKIVSITLGMFSIVQLERPVQLLIPCYDYCIPDKECPTTTDSPCEMFRRIKFPIDQFFPPRLDECECDEPATDVES